MTKNPVRIVDESTVAIGLCSRKGIVIRETLIDREDLPKVEKYRWHFDGRSYAKTSWRIGIRPNGTQINKFLFLHHLIIGRPPDGLEVDHKKRNSLDNRKGKLHFVTRSANQLNKSAHKTYGGKPKSSKYRHVFYRKTRGKWQGNLPYNGKRHYCGLHLTEEEAHSAVCAKMEEMKL